VSVEFQLARLQNGLTVIAEIDPDAASAAMGYFVKTGARDEPESLAGVSHFLEHMVFKGDETLTGLEVNLAFDRLGAQYNAYTSEENTVFYGAVLPELIPELLRLLTRLMRPAIRQEDFETEKKVILEEIALYADRPESVAFERARARYFRGHPLGKSVLGTTESITRLTRDQMVDYHRRRYLPGNMVLAFAGRIDWHEVLDLAAALTEDWPSGEAPRAYPPHAPSREAVRETYERARQTYFVVMAPGYAARDPRRYPASILAHLLGDASSSRLYWALFDTGLVESFGAGHEENDGLGSFYVYASARPENEASVAEALEAVLAELRRDTPGEDEIERAKTKMATSVVFAGETPMSRLFHLGLSYVYTETYEPLSDVLSKVKAVDRRAVLEVLEDDPFASALFYRLGPG